MLSASISNPQEIAEWLGVVRKKECKIIQESVRPVELRYGFLHQEHGVVPLMDNKEGIHPAVSEVYASRRSGNSSNRGSKRGSNRGGRRRDGGKGKNRRGGKRNNKRGDK